MRILIIIRDSVKYCKVPYSKIWLNFLDLWIHATAGNEVDRLTISRQLDLAFWSLCPVLSLSNQFKFCKMIVWFPCTFPMQTARHKSLYFTLLYLMLNVNLVLYFT